MATLSSKVTPTGVATAAQGTLADSALQPTGDGSGLTGVNAFKPVAVTGTTPSLNVGTYNFFDNGTLSDDTTVSFASVPTEARWTYTFTADLLTAYDIENASYLQSFSVATQDTIPTGISFKPDGTKMYVLGFTGQDVNEYDLSTAWDVTTAVFLQNFSVSAQDTNNYDIFFKPDGTKMYILGIAGVDVNEYDLSTAWDVSTASFLQLFSVSAQDTAPRGFSFKPDGTKMYLSGAANDSVYEYDLSTAWDVTTAVFLQSFSVTTQDVVPGAVIFSQDGTRMFVMGGNGVDVNEYNLSTAWAVSSASHVRRLSVSAQDTLPYDIFFKPDGTKMYILGDSGNSVYEYDTVTGTTLTLPSSVQNPPTEDGGVGSKATYEFYTLDGGTNVYLINEEVI